jgi:hypothetical protein
MGKQRSEGATRQREAVRTRVKWVLDNLYHGKQRRMASAMQMSQPLISRIVHGRQGAGPEFLAAMARLPGLNPDWVQNGTGEPLLPPTKGTLPVCVCVLPGWPDRYPELHTGQRHPVADAFCRDSRYWLVLRETCPLLKKASLALLAGDLALLDADDASWLGQLHALVGRIIGVQLQRGSVPSYELGCLMRDPTGYVVDLGEEVARMVEPTPELTQTQTPSMGKRVKRKVQIPKPKSQRTAGDAESPAAAPLQCGPENIVAVCVCLMRLY